MENFNLLFNKWRAVKKAGDKIPKLSEIKRDGKGKTQIGRWHEKDLAGFNFSLGINFKALCDRQIHHAKTICPDVSIPILLSPDYRMIVGLGNPSIYETSMTLHHVYGFPYIPATGIKGALRNYVINQHFELTKEERAQFPKDKWGEKKENKALQKAWFCRMFGCPSESGRVNSKGEKTAFIGDIVFFDAYPTQAPNIEMDVMTVHYPDYYGEKGLPPADWQNPNPITFLTVKDNPQKNKFNKFQFLIGLRIGAENAEVELPEKPKTSLLALTTSFLFEALTIHGIGAKTAVGYGYFKKNT